MVASEFHATPFGCVIEWPPAVQPVDPEPFLVIPWHSHGGPGIGMEPEDDLMNQCSRKMARILRHKAAEVSTTALCDKLRVTESQLHSIVQHSQRKDGTRRFSFDKDGTSVRATYGHSLPEDVASDVPPQGYQLDHSTSTRTSVASTGPPASSPAL